jgi:glycosyltransferase involved in cell wall biosynthesis
MSPDFTIVTASYNYGRFIGDCLESVRAQAGATWEHLVFDGGSTDDTAEVVSRFPDASWVSEPDRGMSDAINKGFRAARGEWVMWLNADDRLLPGALEAVRRFASQHPEADIIYGCWNFIDHDGRFRRTMTLFPHQRAMMLYLGCYIGSTAAFYRRSTVTGEGHLLNINFRYVMDGEYYARLAALGKRFVYLPEVLAEFRLHGDNLSLRNRGKKGVNDWLTLQKQYAESRAFRRAYGSAWFQDDNFNSLVDSFLYLYFRALKPLLKLAHRRRLKP